MGMPASCPRRGETEGVAQCQVQAWGSPCYSRKHAALLSVRAARDTLQMSKVHLHLTWAVAGAHLKAAVGRHRQLHARGAMDMAVGCVGLASSSPRLYLPGLYCLQGGHQLPAKDTHTHESMFRHLDSTCYACMRAAKQRQCCNTTPRLLAHACL